MDQLLQAFKLLLTDDLTRQELAACLHPPVDERTAARLLKRLEDAAPLLACAFFKRPPAAIGKKGDSRVRYYRMQRL